MDERRSDILTPALAARYAASFDRDVRDTAPQGIHWCLNTPEAATAGLGVDGHPVRSDYPDLPRRMWASSDVTFHATIPVGATVERVSQIAETHEKSGKTGRLVFVTVAHEVIADGTPVVSERQTIVYRAAPPVDGTPPPAPPPLELALETGAWHWQRDILPQPPLLFRYSALTFNSHRIHYDLPYARDEEGYPGLVVHGPLMASLLLDLADRELGPDALARFTFRAASPAFAGAPLKLLGRRDGKDIMLAVATPDGGTIMTATAEMR
jgi:3-methylfumaryl-CoA hydratase